MPKINVYLPDNLAAAVREANLAVSPICQKALAEAVRLVGRARHGVTVLRAPDFDPATTPQLTGALETRMTPRLRRTVELAGEAAAAGILGSTHLLIGILDEGTNLGALVLETLGVDADALRTTLEGWPAEVRAPSEPTPSEEATIPWRRLSLPARLALASALEASVDFSHNYLGCEHLLLGLLDSADGGAAQALGSLGIGQAAARQAVTSALAGFAHARAEIPEKAPGALDEVLRRLEALERRLALAD